MALETTTNRSEYAGNGVTTNFSFPYYFLEEADLKVILRDNTTLVETLQTLTTHYTITGEGEEAGGTVTMLSAPASGKTLIIYRDPSIIQDKDFRENDSLPAEQVEEAYDRAAMISQRLKDRVDRKVGVSDGMVLGDFDLNLPSDLNASGSAGKVIIVNQTEDGFEMGPTADEIEAASDDAAAAAASAAAAATSETNAATSATNAATSATAAATSATAAATSATAAQTAETNAETAETNAETAETNAAASAAAAAASASSASTSASTATTQASNASTSASAAATSASAAATSATNAATSATNAATSATDAATSATAAAATIASAVYRDVIFKSFSDSPYTVTSADNGKLIVVDTSSGAVAITLPLTSGLTLPFNISIKLNEGQNAVTISPSGSDTINGQASKVISALGSGLVLLADDTPSPDEWSELEFGDTLDPEYDAGNSGTSKTIDFANGYTQKLTMTGNCTLTLSNPKSGANYILRLLQDGTGSRTMTWPGTVKWPGGTAPTLTTTAAKVDLINLYYDGTSYYGAFVLNY